VLVVHKISFSLGMFRTQKNYANFKIAIINVLLQKNPFIISTYNLLKYIKMDVSWVHAIN
jgi:hypothetical protein